MWRTTKSLKAVSQFLRTDLHCNVSFNTWKSEQYFTFTIVQFHEWPLQHKCANYKSRYTASLLHCIYKTCFIHKQWKVYVKTVTYIHLQLILMCKNDSLKLCIYTFLIQIKIIFFRNTSQNVYQLDALHFITEVGNLTLTF